MLERDKKIYKPGIAALRQPILPLVNIVKLLFFTGPFETVEAIIDELSKPVETETAVYENPQDSLSPYLTELKELEILKKGGTFPRLLIDEQKQTIDLFLAVDLWLAQLIVTKELETINSILCGPSNCDLCCIGPDDTMQQDFFEIPLQDDETALFSISKIDNEETRKTTPYSEPSYSVDEKPFYQEKTALYHWHNGWSMILPRGSVCPQLEPKKRHCTIYPQRPDVCRRPQIFCYVLERFPELDKTENNRKIPAFMHRNKLLAIWDCPYVKKLQDEIADYAALCSLELIFKKNKE